MNLLGVHVPFTAEESFAVAEDTLPTNETAWSEDALYQAGNIAKYNPDDLIGKKGFSIYTKMMLDEQVKAAVQFKRDAITSRAHVFEVDESQLGEEEAARRIAISEHILETMHGTSIDAFNGVMTAMWQGVSYTEKVFAQIEYEGKTYWGIDKLKLKPFDTFKFKVDKYGNVEALIQTTAGSERKLNIKKFIHHVQNPEYDAQYGQSELREAYRAWFSKDMAIRFYNMWLERSASGFKWINTKSKLGTPAYTALQRVLSNTVNGAGMILGGGDEFNIEFPDGKGEAFKVAIDMHDLGIARALLVPNLMGITPAGQTGSFSQSDTQLEAFLWTLDQDATRLEEVLNEQLFRQLGELNFGDAYWPRIKFQPISEKRKLGILELWEKLVSAKAVKPSDTDRAHIRELLEFPEVDEGSVDDDDTNDTNSGKSRSADGSDNPADNVDDGKGDVDETIMGRAKALYNKQVFTKAMQRVDFKVIQRTTEVLEQGKAVAITELFYAMTQDVVEQVKVDIAQLDEGETPTPVKFDKKDKTKLKNLVNTALQDFWKVGQRHAENEIDKAQGLAFSMKVDRERLEFISQDFFKVKSFRVAGKLTDDAIAIISQAISNGVKGGKTFKTIEQDIYLAMGADGFLNEEDYAEALGAAMDTNIKNPQARIDTMLRTNGFEAVNEARYSYFTDPQLDGFVEALEYTAVMDGRTTQVCQHLDGHIHVVGSEEWTTNRPPNHYNCRSLLMAVTQIDSWVESEASTIAPQKGFE